MPLLHRRAFSQQKPPADLRPDEEVFLCKITHEIFRTYEYVTRVVADLWKQQTKMRYFKCLQMPCTCSTHVADKDKVKEEQRRRFEEEKQQRREEKERQKLEKEREREKMKEEKKKYAEQRKLWNKRREDMECEDLKELPCPVPVRTRLPAELFGDALMILEFLQAFGDFFDLKDEFPEGVSLEVLEEALVGSDPEGPLCELLFFFLSAIFQALAEEQEEVAKEQTEDLSEALDDDSDPTKSALSAVASLAAAWPQLHQGCSLKQLDLDSCTLSEILRLHILASGSDCSHGNAKFRYQKQGGFTVMDDPCVELRLAEPVLLKKLACTSVYDLTSGEKLHILQALAGKLLTLASCRDLIEDCLEEQKAARQEVREIRAEQHRREREETAHRIRLRKEEKIKEQMQRLKLREQEVKGEHQMNSQCAALNSETPAEWNTEEGEETTSPTNQQKVKAEVDLKGKEPQQQRTSEPKPSSCPTAEELQNEQEKVQALQELIQKAAARTCLQPLGRDRLYRRYWLLPSAAALFVEDDCFGLTEDMLQPAASSVPDSSTNMEDKEGEKEELAGERSCLAPTCSGGLPLSRPNRWSLYSSVEEVDQLIKALNPRGDRESRLKEALQQERPRLQQVLQHSDKNKYNHTESTQSDPESPVSAEALMEMRLRDLLLDIEDRIHQGGLGTLKVMDRQVWRLALDAGNYELHCSDGSESGGMNGQLSAMEMDSTRARDRLHELKTNGAATSSGSATPQAVSSTVRSLAHTLLQIEHGIERRFLQAPLGDEDSRKDQKTKKNKKKDEDQASDDGSESGHVVRTVLERWRESLQSCTSLSQVFIHLSSLERSVLWSRSVLNARCRICRRKGDADNMLLCDGCDRGHHTHCLRPRLKSVPEGDWFCPDCRPKQKSSRLPSRQRSSVDEEEDNSDEVVQEESEEESEEVVSTKKTQTLNPKGKGQQATPKGQQATPKGQQAMPKGQQATPKGQQATPKGPQAALQNNIVSAGKNSSVSRTSGKKSTPPSSKTPPRSRSQSDNHLRVKTLASNGNAKTSADRSSCRKRPQADVTPPSKPSRLIPSSAPTSSSSRRSSGRNQGVHELSACEQLTVELVRHEDSWPFMKLVSRTQVPDYYDIIKKPIALSTIREKVNNCEYKTAGEYVADVELMFTNCLLYNHHHTNEAQAGQRLQLFFHDELHKVGLSDCGFIPPSKRSRH
ncbi:bromodomain adjacent to zinc finger domain protein 1A [Thalassophryne amazonica]|uniref:bromodomain adjacent to zinc finger domain protein 1A n=1 Tax=Thalassophryne amazonica TaxID=390379 RepID=UPI0014722A2E|nr:bromodomain adjacent to zinc finger domain protein 1A [Thalassophryne amazonica]